VKLLQKEHPYNRWIGDNDKLIFAWMHYSRAL